MTKRFKLIADEIRNVWPPYIIKVPDPRIPLSALDLYEHRPLSVMSEYPRRLSRPGPSPSMKIRDAIIVFVEIGAPDPKTMTVEVTVGLEPSPYDDRRERRELVTMTVTHLIATSDNLIEYVVGLALQRHDISLSPAWSVDSKPLPAPEPTTGQSDS